jgi:hypothetical protein
LLLKPRFVSPKNTTPSFQRFLHNKRNASTQQTRTISSHHLRYLKPLNLPIFLSNTNALSSTTFSSSLISRISIIPLKQHKSFHNQLGQSHEAWVEQQKKKTEVLREAIQERIDEDSLSPTTVMIIAIIAGTLVTFWAIKEIVLPTSTFQIYYQSFGIVKEDPEVEKFLGNGLYGYGKKTLATAGYALQHRYYYNKNGDYAILIKYVVEGNERI